MVATLGGGVQWVWAPLELGPPNQGPLGRCPICPGWAAPTLGRGGGNGRAGWAWCGLHLRDTKINIER